MADWSHPQLVDSYTDVLTTHLNGRDVDAITLQKSAPSNLPNGAMAYDRARDLFKEWNGSVFVDKGISIAGGGTGATNATQARVNLGLGSMAVQNSNAISITGGTISGVTFDASALASGVIALARGGTGASLALGANGTVLQSNGSAIVFSSNGSLFTNLNASNLSSGVITSIETKAGFETKTAPSVSAGTLVLNYALGQGFVVTLDQNVTTLTLQNWPVSGKLGAMTLVLIQDSTGGRTVTWPASVKHPYNTAPTLSAATLVDIFVLLTWDGGTTVRLIPSAQGLTA